MTDRLTELEKEAQELDESTESIGCISMAGRYKRLVDELLAMVTKLDKRCTTAELDGEALQQDFYKMQERAEKAEAAAKKLREGTWIGDHSAQWWIDKICDELDQARADVLNGREVVTALVRHREQVEGLGLGAIKVQWMADTEHYEAYR